jgi:rhodanese-related sulfurtransferase
MTHPKIWLFFLLSVFVLTLTACANPTPAPTPTPVDPKNMPVEVDAATVQTLRQRPDVLLIDVREPDEYQAGHIPGAVLWPLRDLPQHLDEVPKDKTVIAVCRSGNRSAKATDFLRETGFDNVHNMQGGMIAWEKAGYEVEK